MTREDRNKLCSVCNNRAFNPKQGLVCGLTNLPATFDFTCNDYSEDHKEIRNDIVKKAHIQSATNKTINKGRYALFVVGALYLGIGFFEGFFMAGHDIMFAVIDWVIAGLFIGLGIWSYRKASTALIIGLGLYVLLMVLFLIADPISIVRGIIWKVVIIGYLIYAIRTALDEEKIQHKRTQKSPDLLDQ